MDIESPTPAILAPAGNRLAFLAALAAGAEAIYCGLKAFSARMETQSFTLEQLRDLVPLAHSRGARVFITLNALIKPGELDSAGRLLDQLHRHVRPDAVIVQDLAMAQLVRQTGFSGEVHWSTLANATYAAALRLMRARLPIDRIVLPRELSIDEVRSVAAACPPGMSLEVFIHGALCYGISGRCYWSSFLGGKSGLRGRCVQPCRRLYTQGREDRRYFSCLDLSIDVLVKVLLGIPQIRTWKIEGRKKGPHYVYYVVSGYRLLRDHGSDPRAKKDALHYLSQALGRPATHYRFLPQRPQSPVNPSAQTGSGMLVARIRGAGRRLLFSPRQELLAGDLLRIGYEDAAGHRVERIGRPVPKGGRYVLPPAAAGIPAGTPVFLIDRREKALVARIKELEAELPAAAPLAVPPSPFRAKLQAPARARLKPMELNVHRYAPRQNAPGNRGLWLSPENLKKAAPADRRDTWWWLPPVIFPDDEQPIRALIQTACSRGDRTFVLNDPWQATLFEGSLRGMKLWAGPFCNLANPLALESAAALGLAGAIASPELAAEDYRLLARQSPLPLGIVVGGSWPLSIARAAAEDLRLEAPFRSPKGEEAWAARYGGLYWVFPGWRLDLQAQIDDLRRAGYSLFVHLVEPVPPAVTLKQRPGLWNWEGELV